METYTIPTQESTSSHHETGYFTKPGVENVLNSAKTFNIDLSNRTVITLNRSSIDIIFRFLDLTPYQRNSYFGILIISYSDLSEDEDIILSSAINSVIKSKRNSRNSNYRHYNLHAGLDKAVKLPPSNIGYFDTLFESIDLISYFNFDPQEIIELYEVQLINGRYCLTKKKGLVNAMRMLGKDDDKELMTVHDFDGNMIEIYRKDNKDVSDEKRNWIMIRDCEDNEVVVNLKGFREAYDNSEDDYVTIMDHLGIERRILKNTLRDHSKQSLLSKYNKTVIRRLEPEFGVENIGVENDRNLFTFEGNDPHELIEDNEASMSPAKPTGRNILKSKKPINATNTQSFHQQSSTLTSFQVNDSNNIHCSIPIEIIFKYIKVLYANPNDLPEQEEIIDSEGTSRMISPYKAASDYLRRFYMDEMYQKEVKCIKVENAEDNTLHLISEDEYGKVIKEGNMVNDRCMVYDIDGKEIVMLTGDDDKGKRKTWVEAYDVNKRRFYMNNMNLLDEIRMMDERNIVVNVKDYEDKEQKMHVGSFLAYLFYENQKRSESRRLSKGDTKEIKEDDKGKLKVYTDIIDRKGKMHIVIAKYIMNYTNEKSKILVDENQCAFYPNLNDIEYFDKGNELHQLYDVNNDKGERVFVQKPIFISIIDDIILLKETRDLIPVTDYNVKSHNIPRISFLKLLPLSTYYSNLMTDKEDNTPLVTPNTKDLNELISHREEQLIEDDNNPLITQGQRECPSNTMKNLQDIIIGKEDASETNQRLKTRIRHITQIVKKYKTKRSYKHIPYSFIDHDINSYYEVPDITQHQKILMSKSDILSELNTNRNSKAFSKDILISTINDYNNNYEYMEIEDYENSKFYTRKITLLHYINKLINNEPLKYFVYVPNELNIPLRVNLQQTLTKHFFHTPSPYLKDGVLVDPNNTLYEDDHRVFKYYNHGTYAFPTIDLFEYMTIKDINDSSFIVRKPFVRSLLYTQNPILNVPIVDSANQLRLVSPIAVLGPSFSNIRQFNSESTDQILINDINIYIKVKDVNQQSHLIEKKAFDEFKALVTDERIGKDNIFSVVDRNRRVFKARIHDMIPKDKKIRQWVMVNDVQNKKCLIYKNLLLKIMTRNYLEEEEFSINDINNKQRKINPWLIRLKLKNDYMTHHSLQ